MEITSGQPTVQVGGGYGNGGFGCDGGWGIMFLAFLAMMGGGGLWNRGDGVPQNVATTDTVNNAMNYSNLQQQNGQIIAEVQRQGNANMQFMADKYMELQRDIAGNGMAIQNVLQQFMECCCAIQRQIDAQTLDFTKQQYEARIHNDERFCAIEKSMTAQFCALNERLSQDENRRLRETVDNLRDDVRMMRLAFGLGNNGSSGNYCCNNSFGFPNVG